MTSLSVDQLRERRRQKILARSQAVHSIARYEGNTLLLVGRRGLVVLNRGLKLRPSPPVSADFISVPFSFVFIPTHSRRTSIPFAPVLAENSIHTRPRRKFHPRYMAVVVVVVVVVVIFFEYNQSWTTVNSILLWMRR